MNCNERGTIGLIKVVSDLYSRGWHVFLPFDDYSPVDLIAMDNHGNVLRFQVKFRSGSNLLLHASSVVNGKRVAIDRTMIDGWAVFLPETGNILYIPTEAMGSKGAMALDPNKDYNFNWRVIQTGSGTSC